MAQDFIQSGGIEYARELLEKSLGSQKAVTSSTASPRAPGAALRLHPPHGPRALLNFIQGEHPQTVALILSYLEPKNAALVLGGTRAGGAGQRGQGASPRWRGPCRRPCARWSGFWRRTFPPSRARTTRSRGYRQHRGDHGCGGPLHGEADPRGAGGGRPGARGRDQEADARVRGHRALERPDVQKVLREVDSPELAKALKGVEAEVQDRSSATCPSAPPRC